MLTGSYISAVRYANSVAAVMTAIVDQRTCRMILVPADSEGADIYFPRRYDS